MRQSVGGPDSYRQQVLDQLAGDDPLAILEATLLELPSLVEQTSLDAMERRPTTGDWSARQVLEHLSDSDMVFATRLRMTLTLDRPLLVGYDQDASSERFSGLDASHADTLERWRALRRANVRLCRSLASEELQRVGVHSERGEETVALQIQLQAGHDRMHLEQLRRALSSLN